MEKFDVINILEIINIKLDSLFDESINDNTYLQIRDIRDYIQKKIKELEK